MVCRGSEHFWPDFSTPCARWLRKFSINIRIEVKKSARYLHPVLREILFLFKFCHRERAVICAFCLNLFVYPTRFLARFPVQKLCIPAVRFNALEGKITRVRSWLMRRSLFRSPDESNLTRSNVPRAVLPVFPENWDIIPRPGKAFFRLYFWGAKCFCF